MCTAVIQVNVALWVDASKLLSIHECKPDFERKVTQSFWNFYHGIATGKLPKFKVQ